MAAATASSKRTTAASPHAASPTAIATASSAKAATGNPRATALSTPAFRHRQSRAEWNHLPASMAGGGAAAAVAASSMIGGGGNTTIEWMERECGLLRRCAHRIRVSTRACDKLVVSTRSTYHPALASNGSVGITSMRVDPSERRYLLCGATSGAIRLFDTRRPLNRHTTKAQSLSGTQWYEGCWHTPRPAPRPYRLPVVLNVHRGVGDGFAIGSVEWFPFDTGLFVTGSLNARVSCYDTNAFAVATDFNLSEPVYAIALSPVATAHALIATATRTAHLRLCDMNSGAFSHTLIGHRSGTDVVAVCWHPTNEYQLISGGSDGTVRVWDIRRSGTLFVCDQFNTSTDGTATATAAGSGSGRSDSFPTPTAPLARSNSTTHVQSHSGTVTHLQVSSDGRWLYSSGTDGRLKRWDLWGRTQSAASSAAFSGSTSVNRTGSGSAAAAGGMSGAPTNTLIHYSGATNTARTNRFTLDANTNRYLFYPAGNNKLLQFDVQTGLAVRELSALQSGAAAHTDRVLCTAYHTARDELFTGAMDGRLQCWTPAQWDAEQSVTDGKASTSIGVDLDAGSDGDDDGSAMSRAAKAGSAVAASLSSGSTSPVSSATAASVFAPPSFVFEHTKPKK